MQINVPNKKIRKILSSEKEIKKEYGKISNKLMLRINLLQTATCLNEIPVDDPERCHLLTGNYNGCYAICINYKWRIIIKPIGYVEPYDKRKITQIEIIEIVNYHEK